MKFFEWMFNAASLVAIIGYALVSVLVCCGGGYVVWAVLR